MSIQRIFRFGLLALVGLAPLLLWAALKAQAGPPAPQSAVPAAVASQITYQGRLLDGEAPANGVYDFRFTLWDDAAAGTQVGGAILKDDVAVSDSLFTVILDVMHTDFNGQALWLKIEVKADAEVAYTALDPRQPLTPVPYALSLVPGARVRGDSNLPLLELNNQGEGYGLYATSLDGTGLVGQGGLGALFLPPGRHGVFGRGEDDGVMGVSDGGAGTYGGWFNGYGGVKGIGGGDAGVSGASQFSHGVYGQTDSDQPTRAGVHGYSSTGLGIGVQGIGGIGVKGAGMTGVLGEGDVGVKGTSGIGPGVQGEHTGAVPGPGVKGTTTTVSGTGVEGRADFGTGVSGRGEIGVHGTSSVGLGVLGEGAMGVRGTSTIGYGVLGESTRGDTNAVGVRGEADAGTGVEGAGLWGGNFTSSTGIGVNAKVSGGTWSYAVSAHNPTNIAVLANSGVLFFDPPTGHIGVYGAGTDVGVVGLGGMGSGDYGGSFTGYGGVQGVGTTGVGVRGDSTGNTGVSAHSDTRRGIYASSSAPSGAGYGALRADSTGDNSGIYALSPSGNGVRGDSSSGRGVYGSTGSTYGLYTPDRLYAGNGCIGCAVAYVGVNDDSQSLEVGDVVAVSGVEVALEGHTLPVLKVRKAVDRTAMGVVQARGVAVKREDVIRSDEGALERVEIAVDVEEAAGSIAPGEYVFVVVQGLAQVKADASRGAIVPGDLLIAAPTSGRALKAEATSQGIAFGRAVEPLDEGTRLIWALVSFR